MSIFYLMYLFFHYFDWKATLSIIRKSLYIAIQYNHKIYGIKNWLGSCKQNFTKDFFIDYVGGGGVNERGMGSGSDNLNWRRPHSKLIQLTYP